MFFCVKITYANFVFTFNRWFVNNKTVSGGNERIKHHKQIKEQLEKTLK